MMPKAITLDLKALRLYVLWMCSTRAVSRISVQENSRHFGVGLASGSRSLSLPPGRRNCREAFRKLAKLPLRTCKIVEIYGHRSRPP